MQHGAFRKRVAVWARAGKKHRWGWASGRRQMAFQTSPTPDRLPSNLYYIESAQTRLGAWMQTPAVPGRHLETLKMGRKIRRASEHAARPSIPTLGPATPGRPWVTRSRRAGRTEPWPPMMTPAGQSLTAPDGTTVADLGRPLDASNVCGASDSVQGDCDPEGPC